MIGIFVATLLVQILGFFTRAGTEAFIKNVRDERHEGGLNASHLAEN